MRSERRWIFCLSRLETGASLPQDPGTPAACPLGLRVGRDCQASGLRLNHTGGFCCFCYPHFLGLSQHRSPPVSVNTRPSNTASSSSIFNGKKDSSKGHLALQLFVLEKRHRERSPPAGWIGRPPFNLGRGLCSWEELGNTCPEAEA